MVGDQGYMAWKGSGSARSSHLYVERYLLPRLPSKGNLGYPAIRHHCVLSTRSDLGPAEWNFLQVRGQVRSGCRSQVHSQCSLERLPVFFVTLGGNV